MGSLPHHNDKKPAGLRDIYSLIDTMLVEQGSGGLGVVGPNSYSSPMSKSRSTRRMLPSSSCSLATSSVYTTGTTALCIFDDDTVDTFGTTKRHAWPQQHCSRNANRLSHTASPSEAVSSESCPWEDNWAELTLRSEASLVAPFNGALLPPPPPLSLSSWPVPSLRHRPPPHHRPPEAAAANNHDEVPASVHHYFTWKPMYHQVEV
jgi:hypothetical protein